MVEVVVNKDDLVYSVLYEEGYTTGQISTVKCFLKDTTQTAIIFFDSGEDKSKLALCLETLRKNGFSTIKIFYLVESEN